MPLLDSAQLDSCLNEIVRRLRAALDPLAIYLYGSYAYGSPGQGSDLDLLVVVQADDRSPYERDAKAGMALLGIDFPIDVQVYTRAEFEERSSLPVSFERTVRHKGRQIYAA